MDATAAQQRNPARKRVWLARALLALFGVLFLLFVVLVVWLRSDDFQQRVTGLVRQALADATFESPTLERVDVSLLSLIHI